MMKARAAAALLHASLFFVTSPSSAQPVRSESAMRTAQAETPSPAPVVEAPAPPIAPAPPAPSIGPDTASPSTTMEGLHAEFALGAGRWLGTTAGTMMGGRIALQRWWDNFALVGGFHIASDANEALAGGASFGARVLGSSTKSGAFAGMGLGLLHLTAKPPYSDRYAGTVTEDKYGANAYAELGAIARGRFVVAARLDLPFFSVSDSQIDRVESYGSSGASGRLVPTRTVTHPVGIGLELGFIF